ncbi:GNAT family N-acetyltransferase [Paenibacillus humicola]|uniref:GNAT family N-acetyltransferase n=1 Tax=Paenibacillus humicola TaxID=3110540 RepID=UPI00237A2B05|nr:GNAT family N-acetyltransferase [Paenibacillus humicola]
MEVRLLSPAQLEAVHNRLLAFCRKYGDSRLTAAALRELRELKAEELAAPESAAARPAGRSAAAGTANAGGAAGSWVPASREPRRTAAVAVAVGGGRLAGVAFAADAGERACLVAVRPEARGRGTGASLLLALRSRWGRLSCSVAADNPASMQMCFRAGMKAVGLFAGPTGKPTLRFESEPEN